VSLTNPKNHLSSKRPNRSGRRRSNRQTISCRRQAINHRNRRSSHTPLLPPEPTRPVVQPPRSRPTPRPQAPRADVSHWRGLAGALGIEVPDEEPEEAEEAVVEAELVAEAEPVAEPEPVVETERVDSEPPDTIEDGAEAGWSEPATSYPAPLRGAEPDWLRPVVDPDTEVSIEQTVPAAEPVPAPAPPPARTVPSLFDGKAFSIDTPGVLDRIFEDSDEDTRPAIPAGFEEREEFSELDDDLDDAIDLSLDDEDDEDDVEEDGAEAASDAAAATEPAVAEAEGDEPRRRRRRRRRRRKPGKNGADEAAAAEPAADTRRSSAPPEAAAVEQDLAEEVLDDADDRHADDRHADDRHADDRHEDDRHEDDHDEDLHADDHHEDDEDDDDLLTLGVKHSKIPTWDEAVGVVISANMESRAKNPGNGPRGRGRGRGRRP
jgi:ribonuclease E